MGLRIVKCLIVVCIGLYLGLGSTPVSANVAANTRIINQAIVTYHDGTRVLVVNASATAAVSLVPGMPTLDHPPDQTSPYAGPDTQHVYTYTLTAGGNGADIYTVSGNITASDNTTSPSRSADGAPFVLGGTVTTSGSSDTVLQVPSDGTSNASVNGIEVGDTIVINGQVRVVSGLSDPVTGEAAITLDSALSAAPAAGVSIPERVTFAVDVLSGTISALGIDITVSVQTNVANSAGSVADDVTSTFTSGEGGFVKYVRNATAPSRNAGGIGSQNFTINGTSNTYYTGGVEGRPGDDLEYVLVAENTGTGSITGCAIEDVLPAAFVTFKTGAYGGPSRDLVYVKEDGAEQHLSIAVDADAASLSGANLTVKVGTGADPGTGGTIDAGMIVKVAYQLTIN